MFWLRRSSTIFALLVIIGQLAFALHAGDSPERAGTPLRWRENKVRIAVSSSLFAPDNGIMHGTDVSAALSAALTRWSEASGIEFVVEQSEKQSISPPGATGDGISLITIAPTPLNSGAFARTSKDTPAVTRIFFGRQGYITEADIVLNPEHSFSSDGSAGTFDLESVLLHEIGHLIGLEHSPLMGSIMYAHQAKNGIYSGPVTWQRTLTAPDLAALRAVYGDPIDSDVCCYSIDGTTAEPRQGIVWAEEEATGRVTAWTNSSSQRFNLAGLRGGSYRLFWQASDSKFAGASQISSSITISQENPSVNGIRLGKISASPARLEYIGLNAQLAKIPVRIEPGKRITIYLAGQGLRGSAVRIGSTSAFVSVLSESLRSLDYGSGLDVVSVDILVDSSVPGGSYTVFAETEKGERSYLPAAMVVSGN